MENAIEKNIAGSVLGVSGLPTPSSNSNSLVDERDKEMETISRNLLKEHDSRIVSSMDPGPDSILFHVPKE